MGENKMSLTTTTFGGPRVQWFATVSPPIGTPSLTEEVDEAPETRGISSALTTDALTEDIRTLWSAESRAGGYLLLLQFKSEPCAPLEEAPSITLRDMMTKVVETELTVVPHEEAAPFSEMAASLNGLIDAGRLLLDGLRDLSSDEQQDLDRYYQRVYRRL